MMKKSPSIVFTKFLWKQSNDEFQRTEKLKQMDASYERLMAERQLIK